MWGAYARSLFGSLILFAAFATAEAQERALYCPWADTVVAFTDWDQGTVTMRFGHTARQIKDVPTSESRRKIGGAAVHIYSFNARRNEMYYEFELRLFSKIGWRLWNRRTSLSDQGRQRTQVGWCICSKAQGACEADRTSR